MTVVVRRWLVGTRLLGSFMAFVLLASSVACRPSPPASVASASGGSKASNAPTPPRPVRVKRAEPAEEEVNVPQPDVADSADGPPPAETKKKTSPRKASPPAEDVNTETEAAPVAAPKATRNTPQAASARPLPPPEDKIREPVVLLSQYHAATCVIQVGDAFPDFQLNDCQGQTHTRGELLTNPLTVVVMWSANDPVGMEQFTRLQRDILARFGESGVGVVAIHVGDEADKVGELVKSNGIEFPVLLDGQRQLFDQVAKSRLPRTYLLGRDGRVLWFDLEYSRSSRRELSNAIYFHFNKLRT